MHIYIPGAPPGPEPLPRPTDRPMGTEELDSAGWPALAQRIKAYLEDELTASNLYRQLAGQVKNKIIRAYLEEAAEDEEKHYRLLCPLYRRFTSRTPQAQPREIACSDPREGLITAIDGEIRAYAAYKDEYQRFQDPTLRHIFFELLSDEIKHAVRFNTALHILSGPA